MDRRFDPVSRWLIDARRTVRRPLDLGWRATVAIFFVLFGIIAGSTVVSSLRNGRLSELLCLALFLVPALVFFGHATFTGYLCPRYLRTAYRMRSVETLDYQSKQNVPSRFDRAAEPLFALSVWIMIGIAAFPIVIAVAYLIALFL